MAVMEDKKEKKDSKKDTNNTAETIKRLVDEQDSDGCWKNLSLIDELFGSEAREIVSQQQNPFAAVAYLLAKWIEKHHPQKQYSLIIKKAISFASKDADQFKQFPSLFDQYIQ